jgi:hypothetical protein
MKNLLIFTLAVAFSSLVIAQVDLEKGLVGYYSFDNVVDDTIVVNKVSGTNVMPDGTIRNGPEWTDGISGDALLFNDQSNEHVAFGTYDPSADTDELSVSVWVNWKGLDSRWHSVCGKRDGWDPSLIMWDICLDMNSGGIQFETNTANGKVYIITPDPPAIDDWTHIAVTFDGSLGTIYVDGEWANEGEMTFGLGRDAEFHLGCGTTGGIDPFNGAIDEFRVYNRVLSEDEIAALYKLPTSVDRNNETSISDFMLYQNYPNPFNPTTVIRYQLPATSNVSLKVYNLLGQEVATLYEGIRKRGDYEAIFDGSKLAGGVYFYRLTTSTDFVQTRKLLLLK